MKNCHFGYKVDFPSVHPTWKVDFESEWHLME